MNDKLIITVREPDEGGSSANVVCTDKTALAMVREVCAKTNRTQQDIVSRMIEWAYDHVEIQQLDDDGGDSCMTFGDKVKMHRIQKGWTLEDMSKLTGLSVQAISALETGKNNPRPVSKMAIASALHVKPSALDDDVYDPADD